MPGHNKKMTEKNHPFDSEAIMSISDENERDHELGLLAGSGIYFALSTGAAPEKLGANFLD